MWFKIFLLIAVFCIVGCGSGSIGKAGKGLEPEVYPVVEKYLESSAAGNWKEVYNTLSGEALAETKANAGRVKSVEKIVSKELQLTKVCEGVTEVSADVTKSVNGVFDRLAYNFRLKKHEGGWLIYKTTYGYYHHGELKAGHLPPGAAGVIKTYIELPFSQKRKDDYKYLSGVLLRDSQKASLLPLDSTKEKDQENLKTVVKSLDCLGIADGYAVVRVVCDVVRDKDIYHIEVLVDVLDVNGTWKICGVNVTRA